jgi:hypothetical protein
MDNNPYQSPSSPAESPKTRPVRWLVWSGLICLALAVLCFLATVVGMLVTFNTIGRSSTALSAEQVARGISIAMIPTLAVVPLGALGILLLILGFVFRRPAAEQKRLRSRG